MGVMGQIYGSRVVVGLAAPSPAALGAVGKMLVKFNSSMYTTFNKNRIQAAGKSKASAQKELETAKEQLNKYQKSTGQLISQGAKTSYNRIAKMAGNKGPALAAKNSIESLGRAMAAAGAKFKPKLMAKTGNFTQPAKQAAQLFKNLSSMDRTHQKEVVKWMKHRHDGQVRAVKTMVREGELRKYTKEELAKEIELLVKYDNEYKEINEAVTDNFTILDKITDEERKHKKIIDEKAKAAKKAEDLYQKELKDSARAVKLVAQKTKELVQTLKTGFTEAVQNSTVALTAFYYKLNQSTETLITFERELLNANSVFNITREELFKTGDEIVQFGQKFGMEMQNGATGLYQLASAGLSANEALQVLPNTLKLSMAVQGDHNTISKLTAQTIMGFGMAFEDSGIIVDKFAHSIQKSLIEYQDLASAVKFALPFFTTTGQSIDQLLGALEVLTNRALEAGIAGRGLRQGLAELAESLGDNTAAFKKLGVVVADADGNMLQLTEIAANFAEVLEEGVINDTELLTTLIEDLNVRGATAFVHLVQSSDEFTQAVKDLENAGGELDEMVRIQNESLGAQLQILRNNVQAIFLLRDAEYESELYMNRFHEAVAGLIAQFQALLVVEEDGTYVLTEFGRQLQDIAISGVYMFVELAKQVVEIIKEFTAAGKLNLDLLKLYVVPLKIIMDVFGSLSPEMQRVLIYAHMMNKIIPLQAIAMTAYAASYALVNMELIKENLLLLIGLPRKLLSIAYSWLFAGALMAEAKAQTGANIASAYAFVISRMSYRQQLKAILLYPIRLVWMKLTWLWENLITTSIWANISAVGAATIAWSIFWIVATAGVILLVGGLIAALYVINEEFGLMTIIMEKVGGAIQSLGEWFEPLWEDIIYPFIYNWGMEFMALVGILYLVGKEIWAYIDEPLGDAWDSMIGLLGSFAEFIMVGADYLLNNWIADGIWYWIKESVIEMGNLIALAKELAAYVSYDSSTAGGLKDHDVGSTGYTRNELLYDMAVAATRPIDPRSNQFLDATPETSYWRGEEGLIPNFAAGGFLSKKHSSPAWPHFFKGMQTKQTGGAIVGEGGPELFFPNQSGQIINTKRTQQILSDIRRRGAGDTGSAQTLIVKELISQNSVNRNTRMSVDTFAGVV